VLKQYNAFSKQLDTKIGPHMHKQMNTMSFPFSAALALKGKLVSEEEGIATRRLEIARRDAVTEMREAYFDLFLWTRVSASIANSGRCWSR
jgi:cobalt-zinc-cadmium efflux system outer membrane protein